MFFENVLLAISDFFVCKPAPTYHKSTPIYHISHTEPTSKIFDREHEIRTLFETHFGKPFPKTRPEWLVNDYTGQRLELDGYCEELCVAFEFQGPDHYRKGKYNDTDEKLKKQLYRDGTKRFECMRHGVKLYEIPFWKRKDQILALFTKIHDCKTH